MDVSAVAEVGSQPPRATPLRQIIEREGRRRRRRRLTGWLVAAAVPLLVVATWAATRPRPVPMAARFRAQPVTVGDVVRLVHATGHVEAVTTVLVGAEISGRIASVEVDYNDHVVEGQVLARFDRTALEAQLAQTSAAVAAARAALAQARIDEAQAQRNLRQSEQLFAHGAISQVEHDNATDAAHLSAQRVQAASAQLASQGAALAIARTNLDHTVIRSPIDGVVITRNVDPGQTVASVFQTPVLFSVAADLRQMEVVAAVDEADIGEVKLHQAATFTVDAYSARVFEGVVTEVRNSPVVVQDVVTYGTVVQVQNLDLALKPGMTATVRIRTATARDVLRVPNAALRFTPPRQTPAAGPAVWVLDGATTRAVDVRPGITDGLLTAVAPGPLSAGTSVLTELTPEGRKAYGLAH